MKFLDYCKKHFTTDKLDVSEEYNISEVLPQDMVKRAKGIVEFMRTKIDVIDKISIDWMQDKFDNIIYDISDDEIDNLGNIDVPGELPVYLAKAILKKSVDTLTDDELVIIKALTVNVLL